MAKLMARKDTIQAAVAAVSEAARPRPKGKVQSQKVPPYEVWNAQRLGNLDTLNAVLSNL